MAVRFKKDHSYLFLIISMMALILLFGVTTIMLSDATSKSYLMLNDTRNITSDSRIAAGYISTKIRRADSTDAVSIQPLESGDAIVLSKEISGDIYDTWIYLNDGYLTEVFINRNTEFSPESGFPVVKISGLQARLVEDGKAVEIDIIAEDNTIQSLYLSLRSER